MAKIYTAQEMRVIANIKQNILGDETTAEMLRQAADLMEREEKREKKYEYATMTDDGWVGRSHFNLIELIDDTLDEGDKLVRREVGEWEEVNK